MLWGKREREKEHVELITYLQLLVGHRGQSCHVVGEVAGGTHVHLGIWSLVVGPHRQALNNKNTQRLGLVHTMNAGFESP